MVFLEHFDEGVFCDTGRVLSIYLDNFIIQFLSSASLYGNLGDAS